jgi:CDP-diacylglycerol--glycerol-3-phosphate 3-phosphatidyltransferase
MFHVKPMLGPEHTLNPDNQFVIDLLTTLRTERFHPISWWHFILRSWEMSCAIANNNPTLKHSWRVTTLFMCILVLSIVILTGFYEGLPIVLRLLPGLVFCVAWQQSDLFWHLGLNRQAQTGVLLQRVGIANTLTELRGLSAAYLLGRLVGGLTTPSWLALTVFLIGVTTDILDGQVARFAKTQSQLGQISDGEADFCLYSALTVILLQIGILAPWLAVVMILRFFVPLIVALGSYFLFAQPVRFGSTVWGKYAGLAQSLYFFVLLTPSQLVFVTRFVNLPLLVITLILLIGAPIAQIMANIRHSSLSSYNTGQ